MGPLDLLAFLPLVRFLTLFECPNGIRTLYRWLVASYDRPYRFFHSLDTWASEVGPVVRIEVRRSHRTLRLADSTTIRPGDQIGVLHLNNDRVVGLHADGVSPIAVGFEFRRQMLASLHALARLTGPGGWLSEVRAFEATTIFLHQGFRRLGFEADPHGLAWPRLVAAYQRALRAYLDPAGPARHRHAQRLWISRDTLLRRHGIGARAPAVSMSISRSTAGASNCVRNELVAFRDPWFEPVFESGDHRRLLL